MKINRFILSMNIFGLCGCSFIVDKLSTKTTIVIENKSDNTIYLYDRVGLMSYGIYGDTKIYFVTLAPIYTDIYPFSDFDTTYNVTVALDPAEKKKIKSRLKIDAKKNVVTQDITTGKTTEHFAGFVSVISFCLVYTKDPLEINSYQEYVKEMATRGFAATGYYKKNTIYFTITNHDISIDEEATKNIASFVKKIDEILDVP